MAERTGCPILLSLWSYVTVNVATEIILYCAKTHLQSHDDVEASGVAKSHQHIARWVYGWMDGWMDR
jgi:hypothetical protein